MDRHKLTVTLGINHDGLGRRQGELHCPRPTQRAARELWWIDVVRRGYSNDEAGKG